MPINANNANNANNNVNNSTPLPNKEPIGTPAAVNAVSTTAAANDLSAAERREQKRLEAEQRQRLANVKKPIESRIKRLEEQIAKRQAQKAQVDVQLQDASLYEADKKAQLKTLLADQAYFSKDLGALEEEWLAQQTALEALVAG
jgi:ATP-binding cassette, subfamily F, member 3